MSSSSKSYSEKLRDPRWQKKRLEILERDKFTCQECDEKEQELHVHHRSYRSKLAPWDYEDSALVTLCRDCHARRTELDGRVAAMLGKVRGSELVTFVSILEQFDEWEKQFGPEEQFQNNISLALDFVNHSFLGTWQSIIGPSMVADTLRALRSRLDHIGLSSRLDRKENLEVCQTGS